MIGNFFGKDFGLGGGHGDGATSGFEGGEQFGDAVVDDVFKYAVGPEIFPIVFDGQIGLVLADVQIGKSVPQGRADELIQFLTGRRGDAELFESVGYRVGDAFAVVGKGAVEVKQNGGKLAHNASKNEIVSYIICIDKKIVNSGLKILINSLALWV